MIALSFTWISEQDTFLSVNLLKGWQPLVNLCNTGRGCSLASLWSILSFRASSPTASACTCPSPLHRSPEWAQERYCWYHYRHKKAYKWHPVPSTCALKHPSPIHTPERLMMSAAVRTASLQKIFDNFAYESILRTRSHMERFILTASSFCCGVFVSVFSFLILYFL